MGKCFLRKRNNLEVPSVSKGIITAKITKASSGLPYQEISSASFGGGSKQYISVPTIPFQTNAKVIHPLYKIVPNNPAYSIESIGGHALSSALKYKPFISTSSDDKALSGQSEGATHSMYYIATDTLDVVTPTLVYFQSSSEPRLGGYYLYPNAMIYWKQLTLSDIQNGFSWTSPTLDFKPNYVVATCEPWTDWYTFTVATSSSKYAYIFWNGNVIRDSEFNLNKDETIQYATTTMMKITHTNTSITATSVPAYNPQYDNTSFMLVIFAVE